MLKTHSEVNQLQQQPNLDEPHTHPIDAFAEKVGLRRTQAWVPAGKSMKEGSAASRTRRSREKASERGLKSLSIVLPTELHEQVKALALRTRAGEPLEATLKAVFPALVGSADLDDERNARDEFLETLSGWKLFLIRLLLGTARSDKAGPL